MTPIPACPSRESLNPGSSSPVTRPGRRPSHSLFCPGTLGHHPGLNQEVGDESQVQGFIRQMEDAVAIQRVLDGDVEAFSDLVKTYYGRCTGYALRMLGNRESAEDVVQETFVRAFRGLSGYDHRNRFAAWLFRILVNRCHSAARSGARQTRQMRWRIYRAELEPQVDPQDVITRAAVESALDRLAPEQREAFILRHVEQLSYEEMRSVTGAGISALKMRVARACENLRKELGYERG